MEVIRAMALPRDREEDFRIRMLTLIQDQIRKILDNYRTLFNMLESYVKGPDVKTLEAFYNKILRNDESAKETSRVIEREMNNVGALLTDREDFLRLVAELDKISDTIEGAGFRLVNLGKMKAKLGKDLNQKIVELGGKVLETLIRLREALLAMTLNAETFLQKVHETEQCEKNVDDIYRSLDLALLQSNLKIAPLLLSREIAGMLEDIADRAERAVDTLRALSLVVM